MHYTTILASLGFASSVFGHMEMSYPAPFRSKYNPNVASGSVDYSMTSPLSGQSQFPCKGYQTDFSDATAGASTATLTAGGNMNFTLVGGAPHGGGSCQAALSYDSGKTWKVIHSFLGNCVTTSGQNFDLTVPSDAQTGKALFSWTWYNLIGNREIYSNCASVTIAGSSSKRDAPAVAFNDRPDVFVANLNNGCQSVENIAVTFPDPGPDVTGTGGGSGSITGTCAAVNGIGGADASSSTGSSSGSNSTTPDTSSSASTPAATASSPSSIAIIPIASSSAASSGFATSVVSSSVVASGTGSVSSPSGAASSSSSGSGDGSCSTTSPCPGNNCCSSYGFCGTSDAYCGAGCVGGPCTSGNSTASAGSASSSGQAVRRTLNIRGRPLRHL